jgi:hypothetical protein
MSQKEAIEQLVAEVLDGTELKLKVDSLRLEENLETSEATVHCEVHHEQTGERKVIDGRGVGIVDAFFHGLVNMYSAQFPSLNTIRFSDFAVKADLTTGRDTARSDSAAMVTLRVTNSDGREFVFSDRSPSVTRSSLNVVLAAGEFFINTERAFIAVYRAMQHAREQKRSDSIAIYTSQLSTLVEATSYSEVIEQIKRETLAR